MAKSIMDQLTGYRVKVKKDGREIVNVPGILALPGLLVAPKASIIGMIAAPFLGCSVHLENEDGKTVDVGEAVKNAAETAADRASAAAKMVKEEMAKAWDAVSADDPEGCPLGEENEDEPADQEKKEDDIPTIRVNPEDSEDPEDPAKPE